MILFHKLMLLLRKDATKVLWFCSCGEYNNLPYCEFCKAEGKPYKMEKSIRDDEVPTRMERYASFDRMMGRVLKR